MGTKQKTVIVTGASQRIGAGVVQAFLNRGYNIVANSRNITKSGAFTESGQLILVDGNIGESAVAAKVIETAISKFGSIDALVNNAAVRAEQPFIGMAFQDWRRILSVILDGTFFCAQACVPHIVRAGGGSIVNIGGETGHSGAAGRAHVVTAKAGLAGMTKALALELAPHRITVNCVVPGRIETVRAANTATPSRHGTPPPIGRFGLPEEVAAMVSMLCGPRARYITGQAIHVNGGGWMP